LLDDDEGVELADDVAAAESEAGQVSPITPATPIVADGDDISFS
jgi:hypothetical protein